MSSGAAVLSQETVWLGDIPVATLRPKTGGGVDVFYVHTDQLNTPRKVTNAANQLRWRWDPNPFGEGSPGVIINSAPIAQPGSQANTDWANNAWNQIDGGLSALGNAIGNIGRPKDMTRDEESVYDRYCRGGGDPCPALKAATMREILAAKDKMNDMLRDKLGLYGSDGWYNHRKNLQGRVDKIFAMIQLGQKLGCDMTVETIATTDLMIPSAPQ